MLQQIIKSVTKLEEFKVKLADTPLSKTHENLYQTNVTKCCAAHTRNKQSLMKFYGEPGQLI
jgi:hypothetical protein